MPTNTDLQYRIATALGDSSTPYGDLTAVGRENRISVSADSPISEQRDTITAGVTRLPNDSVYRIRANASTESIETTRKLQYSPGYTGEVGVALRIPAAPTGDQEVRWGYWGGDDGVYFGEDSTGVFVERIRAGTRQGKVRPDGWNGDLTGREVQTALRTGTITRQQLSLYNFGTVGHEIFVTDDDTGQLGGKRVHNETPENESTLSQQNNPVRVEVDNPASEDFDVIIGDRQASIRGEFTAANRIKGQKRTSISLSGTTWVPLITIRRKSEDDQIAVGILSLAAIADSDIFIQIRSDAGSTTDADYSAPTDVDPAETVVEVDTSPTASITDGFHRFQTLFKGGSGSSSTIGELENVDTDLKNARPVTVFARRTSGTGGTISALNFNWEEFW